MNKGYFFFLILSCFACGSSEEINDLLNDINTEINLNSEGLKQPSGKVIAFYNVENLFDIYDDPDKNDDWFTPESETEWDEDKYEVKLEHISEAINAIHKDNPILVGMVEIENKSVLKDLVEEDNIDEAQYKIITEDSPDERGIDVAFLYNPSYFEYKTHEAINIDFPFLEEGRKDKTRDILYVNGNLKNDDLHIFVNHWPSRREGWLESEHKRVFVAEKLRAKVDEILKDDADAKILIMGDFNDYPNNKSIKEVLGASNKKDINADQLYNLAAQLHRDDKGSYMYKGDWGMLDQMIVSKGFLHPKEGVEIKRNTVNIFDEKFIMFKHPKFGTWQPNRTYSGPRYHGGYSDHLPIYITLK